ncbi:hypothetical protein GF324_02340 [bacterium]|nr:hypothetical protein [bacterium]
MTRIRAAVCLACLLAVSALWTGCDAPRNNPLDPGASSNGTTDLIDNLPVIQNFQVKTAYTEIEGGDPLQVISVEAFVTDRDEVSEVHIEIADSLRLLMESFRGGPKWTLDFDVTFLLPKLRGFQGAGFYLIIYDDLGYVRRSGRQSISRVLDQELALINPQAWEVTSTTPELSWEAYPLGQNVGIEYEVTVAVTGPNIIHLQETVQRGSEDVVTYRITESEALNPGQTYNWHVMVVDDLGNTHTSKTLNFTAASTTIHSYVNRKPEELP